VALDQVGHAQTAAAFSATSTAGGLLFFRLIASGLGAATAGLVGHPVSLQAIPLLVRHHKLTTSRTQWLHHWRVSALDSTDDGDS
jgi:hypothetical protein